MNFILSFNPHYSIVAVQVIWVIGWSLVILSVLHWLPLRVLLIIGLVLVLGHNLLDRFDAQPGQQVLWWAFLHQQFFDIVTPDHTISFCIR